jgi:IS30 family transposase
MSYNSLKAHKALKLAMGKKNHRKTIRSLTRRIEEHQDKIRQESQKELPDRGMIRHWELEILAFERGIRQAYKRLGKR